MSEEDVKEEQAEASTDAKVQPYDFKRPNRVPKEQKKSISLIHQTFAQNLMLNLSAFLRMDVSCEFDQIEQVSFQEYISGLVTPSCAATFDMQPLSGYGVIEMNPPIVYSIIDRMLGGSGQVPPLARSFTEIELAIARKLINQVLEDFNDAWAYLLKINFGLQDIQSNFAFIRSIPLREPCIACHLKLTVGETAGMMSVCIPLVNLEPIAAKLRNEQWNSRVSGKQSDEIHQAHLSNFHSMDFEFSAHLGATQLSMVDLILLQPGDVLRLDQKVKDPIDIKVAGQTKFKGNAGLKGRQKAVSIQSAIVKEGS